MRTLRRVVVVIACLGVVAGCGNGGSDTSEADAVRGPGCAPVAGKQLVLLDDDKKLQTANNIIPVVHEKVARPALAALDKASQALTPERLVALNKATDVDRRTARAAAAELARSVRLTQNIPKGDGGRIVVGASNVSESQSVAFLYEIVLTAAGFDARVQPVGSRDAYEPALESGDVDVVPEYLGTLAEFLNQKVRGADAQPIASGDVDRTLNTLKRLGTKLGLAFGRPAPAGAQNGFAVTMAFAERHEVKTLSDFAAKCSGRATVLAGPADCPRFEFCQPGLENMYGIEVGRFSSLDAGGPKTKEALTSGKATIGLVFTSDAALAG
jgi:osmoprotectant transport system substrate-binding protein